MTLFLTHDAKFWVDIELYLYINDNRKYLNIFFLIDNGDGILLYCLKNLCPLLGDKKYSFKLKKILGKLVYVPNATEKKGHVTVTI